MRATKAIIRLDHLIHNIKLVKAALPKKSGKSPLLCLPVKADAYGHGAVEISKCALANGADALAVATVEEGAELRRAGIKAPILLFSQVLPDEIPEIVENSLSPFVSDKIYISQIARSAEKYKKKISVHLKVDSGMGRIGCKPEEALPLSEYIRSQDCLIYEGTATHFASSDALDEKSVNYTKRQIEVFKGVVSALKAAGHDAGIVSAANSGACVFYRDALFEDGLLDMARPGILLYGCLDGDLKGKMPVKPVMELISALVFVKKLEKGDFVSYGSTWQAERDMLLGVIPAGYGDGLPRALSGRGFFVSRGGCRFPLAGRICMDQCMIDLGAAPWGGIEGAGGAGDLLYKEFCIFGGEPPALGAEDIAAMVGTISYEILCGINKRVPRVYRGGGA